MKDGSSQKDIFFAEDADGYLYYVTDGGKCVNMTTSTAKYCNDVAEIEDIDCFTWDIDVPEEDRAAYSGNSTRGIESEQELKEAVEA